mgnify:CR=1 FL=1
MMHPVDNKAFELATSRNRVPDRGFMGGCLKRGESAIAMRTVTIRGTTFEAGTMFVGRRKHGQKGMDYAHRGATYEEGGYGWTSCETPPGVGLGGLAEISAVRLGARGTRRYTIHREST